VPTFNLVVADVEGHIALQSAGRIPIRGCYERAYRDGSDPRQQWQGLVPFEGMPHLTDPDRQWIATANNRVAADDYPYLLSGCWAGGWRARRIRQLIESGQRLSVDDMREMHLDNKSLRAELLVPHLTDALSEHAACAVEPASAGIYSAAVAALRDWDFHAKTNSVAATIFNVFFAEWCRTVARERFDASVAEFVANGLPGVAGRLLIGDSVGWFDRGNRIDQIAATFHAALEQLTGTFGPEVAGWTWGNWHRLPLRHVLSARGDLGELLDRGGGPVAGDVTTVCNTGYESDGRANAGAGYRMITDLSTSPPEMLAVDCQSQSGNPGSPHYADQFSSWLRGDYHVISLDPVSAKQTAAATQTLFPKGTGGRSSS
jgi:penicillin amidase